MKPRVEIVEGICAAALDKAGKSASPEEVATAAVVLLMLAVKGGLPPLDQAPPGVESQ